MVEFLGRDRASQQSPSFEMFSWALSHCVQAILSVVVETKSLQRHLTAYVTYAIMTINRGSARLPLASQA